MRTERQPFTQQESQLHPEQEVSITALPSYVSKQVRALAKQIHECIYTSRHTVFFTFTSACAAASYPHVFLTGFPIGIISGFLVGQAARQMPGCSSFYLYNTLSYEAGIAQFTLAQISTMTKIWSFLHRMHYYEVNNGEGMLPSFVSGVIAGSFFVSAATHMIDTAYFKAHSQQN